MFYRFVTLFWFF